MACSLQDATPRRIIWQSWRPILCAYLMRRSYFILLGVVLVAAAIFSGAFFMSRQVCVMEMSNPADDLSWLRQEFRLTDAQMARMRELHEGYLPKCAAMCARIAQQKQ